MGFKVGDFVKICNDGLFNKADGVIIALDNSSNKYFVAFEPICGTTSLFAFTEKEMITKEWS